MKDKRFYWIKLKTDFFNQETIDFLLTQDNGCQYIVLYQMLCLQTANNNGIMATIVGEMIVPYDIKKIARDTKYFDFDTVAVALDLFKKLGLIYEEENKVLKIADIDEMVGSECYSANRVRIYREKQKALQCNTNVTQEIEYRDKSIDININNNIYEQEFEKIWIIYPKKQGKKEALKSFVKARKKGVDFELMLKGLENYNNYITNNHITNKYIKQGSTWFNQECWNDDYKVENKKSIFELIDEA